MKIKEWIVVVGLAVIAISIHVAYNTWVGLQKIFISFPRIFKRDSGTPRS